MPVYGYGYRFSRRNSFQIAAEEVLYGPKIGPKGPRQVLVAVWNQADVGYCRETNNVAENLYSRWKARGINCIKPGHPDVTLQGRATQMLASIKANDLMIIATPRWEDELGSRANPESLDFRSLALNDPYWRTNWIGYQVIDEMDLQPYPLSLHVEHIQNMALEGLTKPIFANFTRRMAIPAAAGGTQTINWHEAFNVPRIGCLSIDSYEWHLTISQTNGAIANKTTPETWVSTWNGEGIYNTALSAPLDTATRLMFGRRFTASVTGMAVHLQRNGPLSRGRSLDNGVTILPPGATDGPFVLPTAMTYVPDDKSTGHYVATGRVELFSTSYPQSGKWQPGRYLRNETWSGFVHGSSALYLFPQTPGVATATGYIDAASNTVVITSAPVRPFLFGGAVRITTEGDFTLRGWVRRDSPQLSGTPGGAGTYALDVTKATPVATGTSGAPVTLEFSTEARPWGDDSNPENLAELAAVVGNLNRMQAHPTGGNLLINTAVGGRRAFSVMRCPDINGDASLYKEDMTLAPIQAGYTSEGVAIADSGGGLPLWDFGWPMGFEGFRVTGDDGAVYSYVRSMSNSNRATFFPGYAALGLPARVFGPFELVGFRRVGAGAAVEMTGTSAVIKAGVDDGAATWFLIETTAVTQNEGNSGNTAYTITVRRGGDLSGTNTVTATVSGTGSNPANAADFGGSFPSQVLSFAPAEATKVFTVNVSGDAAGEQNETFAVTLSSPSAGAVLVGSGKSTITCTITNDDAALVGAFIWLVNDSEAGALALPGSPSGATFLRTSDTTFVTRSGISMRSRGVAAGTNSSSFASLPYHAFGNAFHSADFRLAPGDWEVALLVFTDGGAHGTVTMVDNPDGAANVRQSVLFASSPPRLNDTDGTAYTNPLTAVTDAVNNLTYVPVTITDAGGGIGLLRIAGSGPFTAVCAVAIREV